MKRLAYQLRCGLPGIITAFDATTQLCTVQLTITENIKSNGGTVPTPIPQLEDVLLMLPGDAGWCVTFPSLIGSECYVCFADMCINAWWELSGVQNQQVTRRHDLSDGFAILAPRSKNKAIPSYSTTSLEIRSMDDNTKISMDATNGIQLKATKLQVNGTAGNIVASATTATQALPIKLNGVTYYIKLSTTP